MITSAMFYNMGDQGPSPFAVHIGSLVIDLQPFVIGLQSSIIIIPVNILLVQIFRNLRPMKGKPNKKQKSDEEAENKKNVPEVLCNIQVENQSLPVGKLPHYYIYFAYAVCYLSSAASVFFTLLYSIQWGKETSTEWVIAMVTSFFQSVLLLQPVKVVLVAIMVALCVKKSSDAEGCCYDDLVIIHTNAEHQSFNERTLELKKKIKEIRQPSRAIKKYYR